MRRVILSALLASITLVPSRSSAQALNAYMSQSPSQAAQALNQSTTGLFRVPQTDLFRAGPNTYAPRYDQMSVLRQRALGRYGYGLGYASPYAFAIGEEIDRATQYMSAGYQRTNVDRYGYLRLDVQPSTADVYIDGRYMGTADDFRSARRALDAGQHRVDVREPGFRPVSFATSVAPNQTSTYRTELGSNGRRLPGTTYVTYFPYSPYRSFAAPPYPSSLSYAPNAPYQSYTRYYDHVVATRETMYVIPGCYVGNSQPRPEQLRPGCDSANLRVIPPTRPAR